MSRIFVVVTSNGCGTCSKFKNEIWSDLKRDMMSSNLDIVHINLPNTQASITDKGVTTDWIKGRPRKITSSLGNLVQWYPTFLVVDSSTFESQPTGKVYNGIVEGGQAKMIGGKLIKREFIYDWAIND